jgi:hypothetical protein
MSLSMSLSLSQPRNRKLPTYPNPIWLLPAITER